MKRKITFFLPTFCMLCIMLLGATSGALNAQTSAFSNAPDSQSGRVWKSESQINQILQQELGETQTALAQPNLTDWAEASLLAYRSMLTFAQAELQQPKSDVEKALNQAFEQMKNEPVANATARSWVISDMDAKKEELIVRLSEN
jgi:hypothetical protein